MKRKSNDDNFLLYVPIIKHEKWECKKGRVKLFFYHDKLIERFARWLVKKPNVSDIELDELGSSVWMLIDGERSLYDIGEKLKEKFGDKCEPLYDRLALFIRYMVRRGWIGFAKGPTD